MRYDVVVIGAGPAGASAAIKCSSLGLQVLALERRRMGESKPCGGLLTPPAASTLSEELGLKIPPWILSSPPKVGLYYVPPSGRRCGGPVRDYWLLNVSRAKFDEWLLQQVEAAGVDLKAEASFEELDGRSVKFSLRGGGVHTAEGRFIVGADGVYSSVGRSIYGQVERELIPVLQDYYEAEECFEDFYHVIFKRSITPLFSYVIPKGPFHLVGVGGPEGIPLPRAMEKLRDWLRTEFGFKGQRPIKRELWAIPRRPTLIGKGNTVLVGDAAGLCNAFTGEGIRLALESGISASEAILRSSRRGVELAPAYEEEIALLMGYVERTREAASTLLEAGGDDEAESRLEEFVRMELSRRLNPWRLEP